DDLDDRCLRIARHRLIVAAFDLGAGHETITPAISEGSVRFLRRCAAVEGITAKKASRLMSAGWMLAQRAIPQHREVAVAAIDGVGDLEQQGLAILHVVKGVDTQ